jgi:hypothetical protein
LVVAQGKDCFLTGLPDFGKVVTQLFYKIAHNELGMAAKFLALLVTHVWVELLTKVGQKSDRTLTNANYFVANRMPDNCDCCNKSLREVVNLLSQNFVLQDTKALLSETPCFGENLSHCALTKDLDQRFCNRSLLVSNWLSFL